MIVLLDSKVTRVFVPYQIGKDGTVRKLYSLPRFREPTEVAGYIQRYSKYLSRWKLEWREETTPEAIREWFYQIGGRNE